MSKKTNTDTVKNEIELALGGEQINFEEMPDEKASPLNQPVVEKTSAHLSSPTPVSQDDSSTDSSTQESGDEPDTSTTEAKQSFDAPEQEFSEHDATVPLSDEGIEIPLSHAQMAADTFLGIADNVLEIGGGFFIKIRKHKDFYDFEEVVQVIEGQNEKNVKRLKLDDDDKALLRPLLIIIIRKKAKVLTPEQQLAAAVLSILVKKARIAVEMRTENEILVERIRDIIREERSNGSGMTTDHEGDMHEEETNTSNAEFANVMEVAE